MKRPSFFLMLLFGAALAQNPPVRGESHTEDTKTPANATNGEKAAWMQLAQPSDEHEVLEATVGAWTYTMTLWPVPDVEPMRTTGEAESEWVLGGRFVRQVARGEIDGEQFEGIGYTGYDRVTKKYTNVWMDTRGTSTLISAGIYDAGAKSITLEGAYERAGLEQPFKMILKMDSADAYTMEMWVTGVYDILFKNYEVAYSRKK